MREAGAVEVEPHVVGLRPIDPALEVTRLDLITINLLTLEVAIDGMQTQTV